MFATSAELASFTQDDSLNSARGDLLLEQASAAIRTYCSQTFDLVTNDVVPLRGRSTVYLPLPERPVVSVGQVNIDGTEVYDYRVVRDRLYRNARWGGEQALVTVTYTHGFAENHPVMKTVKGVCLQLASRSARNVDGKSSESIGDWSGSWAGGAGGFSLTFSEQSQLDRFRHEWATRR